MKMHSLILSAVSFLSLSASAMDREQLRDVLKSRQHSTSAMDKEQVRDALETPQHSVFIDDKGEFHLLKEGQSHAVQKCWVDPILKKITTQQQADAFNKACYLRAVLMSDNNYKLIALGRLHGGGVFGALAGAFIGKVVVLGVGVGVCTAVTAGATLIAGPAGAAFGTGFTMTALPFIEAASVKAAIGCGILGATITGPV